mmetsp:Transcript_10243/g.15043  ORF Transcript_10243/g.15043 Transcript_10243/m.15043 type:complete len:205 (-) Transcript_10243:117-731(-)
MLSIFSFVSLSLLSSPSSCISSFISSETPSSEISGFTLLELEASSSDASLLFLQSKKSIPSNLMDFVIGCELLDCAVLFSSGKGVLSYSRNTGISSMLVSCTISTFGSPCAIDWISFVFSVSVSGNVLSCLIAVPANSAIMYFSTSSKGKSMACLDFRYRCMSLAVKLPSARMKFSFVCNNADMYSSSDISAAAPTGRSKYKVI